MKFEDFISEAVFSYPKYSQIKMLIIAKEYTDVNDQRFFDNKILNIKKGCLYFIIDGMVEVSHKSTGKIVGLFKGPLPIGFIELHYINLPLEYKIVGHASVLILKDEKLNQFLEVREVTLGMLELLKYYLYCLTVYSTFMQNSSVYNILRGMIYLYQKDCRFHLLHNEGLILYILKRTSISRSQVFKIISDLKKGGYISQCKKGPLLINKPLPLNY